MLNGLVEVVDYLPGMSNEFEAVETLYKVCRRHGEGIERALRTIRERHDHPYADVPPNSLLQLVARREYLKEPVQRLIEAIVPGCRERSHRCLQRADSRKTKRI